MSPISRLHFHVRLLPFFDVDGQNRPTDKATVLKPISLLYRYAAMHFSNHDLLHLEKMKMVYRLAQQWKSKIRMLKRQEPHSKDSDDDRVNIIVPEWLNKMDLIAIECWNTESVDTPVATAETIKRSVLSNAILVANANMATANAMMIPIRLRHS